MYDYYYYYYYYNYTIYRMVPLSMTLSDLLPDFKVTTFFAVEYRKNGAS